MNGPHGFSDPRPVEELPEPVRYVVVVGGVPIAPGEPLTMADADALWQVYARRPGVEAEIRVWPPPI